MTKMTPYDPPRNALYAPTTGLPHPVEVRAVRRTCGNLDYLVGIPGYTDQRWVRQNAEKTKIVFKEAV